MKLNLRPLTLAACAAMLTCASYAKADTVAYTLTGVPLPSGTENDLANYGLAGIEITPTANIDITELGFDAVSLNTGGDTPQVSVFQYISSSNSFSLNYTTGNIISNVIADNSNNGVNSGGDYTYVATTSKVELLAGNTYLIAAPAYWEPTYNVGNSGDSLILTDPAIGNTDFVDINTGFPGWANSDYNLSSLALADPSVTPTGVNFQFNLDPDQSPPTPPSPPAVPEPSTYALLGAGLAFLAMTLRRRAANAKV